MPSSKRSASATASNLFGSATLLVLFFFVAAIKIVLRIDPLRDPNQNGTIRKKHNLLHAPVSPEGKLATMLLPLLQFIRSGLAFCSGKTTDARRSFEAQFNHEIGGDFFEVVPHSAQV
jgi:hypothetical protein